MYTPVHQPYTHQVQAAQAMRDQKAFALLMGMRTGKTKVTIDDWGEKVTAGEAHSLLVVAPAGVYRIWETELKKHLPPDLYARTMIATWVSGGTLDERRRVEQILNNPGPRVFLVNVEALSYGDRAIIACTRFLERGKCMLVVDESTTIKNPFSRRTKAACTLGNLATWRRILSGLPTPRSPLDIFSQFWFLDPMILRAKNYYAFRAHHAVMKKIRVGRRWVQIIVGYINTDEIWPKISPYSFRVKLEDCYDVPPKAYSFREVELTPEQKRLYEDLKRRATTQLESGEHVSATEVIVQLLRLHQLCCGHLVDEDGTVHDVPTNRLNSLVELLDDYDGKAVIWCSYDRDVRAISARLRQELGDEAVACFWGSNRQTREDDSHRFETDPRCTRMVATPGSGGRGRTWSGAGLLVYYSNTDNLEHRDQSEERASGIGKQDPITVVDLIARGTVEWKIVQSLRNKLNLATTITGDNYREWLI